MYQIGCYELLWCHPTPVLVLRSDGTELEVEEDIGYSDGSRYSKGVSVRAPTTGPYTIIATSAVLAFRATGRYTIRVEEPGVGAGGSAQASFTASQPRTSFAETLVLNRTFFGSLSSSDGIWENDSYYDRWPFSLRASRGTVYRGGDTVHLLLLQFWLGTLQTGGRGEEA